MVRTLLLTLFFLPIFARGVSQSAPFCSTHIALHPVIIRVELPAVQFPRDPKGWTKLYPFVIGPTSEPPTIWGPLDTSYSAEPVKVDQLAIQDVYNSDHLMISVDGQVTGFEINSPGSTIAGGFELPRTRAKLSTQLKKAGFVEVAPRIFHVKLGELEVLAVMEQDDRIFFARPLPLPTWTKPSLVGLHRAPNPSIYRTPRLQFEDPLRVFEISCIGDFCSFGRVIKKDLDFLQPKDVGISDFFGWLEENVVSIDGVEIPALEQNQANFRLAKILYFVKQGYLGNEKAPWDEHRIVGGAVAMGDQAYSIKTRYLRHPNVGEEFRHIPRRLEILGGRGLKTHGFQWK